MIKKSERKGIQFTLKKQKYSLNNKKVNKPILNKFIKNKKIPNQKTHFLKGSMDKEKIQKYTRKSFFEGVLLKENQVDIIDLNNEIIRNQFNNLMDHINHCYFILIFYYWGWGDLNPHDFINRRILSPLRLPFRHIPEFFLSLILL